MKGSRARGFSVSITALKGGKTRVIIWRRAAQDGEKRVKIGEFTIGPNEGTVFTSEPIGGATTGNARKVTVRIETHQ